MKTKRGSLKAEIKQCIDRQLSGLRFVQAALHTKPATPLNNLRHSEYVQ